MTTEQLVHQLGEILQALLSPDAGLRIPYVSHPSIPWHSFPIAVPGLS